MLDLTVMKFRGAAIFAALITAFIATNHLVGSNRAATIYYAAGARINRKKAAAIRRKK